MGSLSRLGIKMQFNPGEGIEYTEDIKSNLIISRQGTHEKHTFSRYITRNAVLKKEYGGFSVNYTPVKVKFEKDRKNISKKLSNVMGSIEIILKLKPDGLLNEINGFEKFDEIINEELPFWQRNSIIKIINGKALQEWERDNWENRIRDINGQTFKVNDIYTYADDYYLFVPEENKDIKFKYYKTIHVSEWVKVNEINCLKLNFYYNTDPDKIASQLNVKKEKLFSNGMTSKIKIEPAISLSGTGEMVIDPATLIMYNNNKNCEINFESITPEKRKTRYQVKDTYNYSMTLKN